MPIVKGVIKKLGKRSVSVIHAKDWIFEDDADFYPVGRIIEMRLPIKNTIIDKAISLVTDLLEFTIEKGIVVDLRKISETQPKPAENIYKKIMSKALDELGKKKEGMKKDVLIKKIVTDLGVSLEKVEKMIDALIREGHIFIGRDGFLKKT